MNQYVPYKGIEMLDIYVCDKKGLPVKQEKDIHMSQFQSEKGKRMRRMSQCFASNVIRSYMYYTPDKRPE